MTYDPESEFDEAAAGVAEGFTTITTDAVANPADEHDHPHAPETSNIVVPTYVINAIQAAPSGIEILSTCIDLAVFLAEKNAAYGNSALNPVRVFSKANSKEQILVRMDDKLNRLMNGTEYPGDDDLKDLLGYLLLYFVAAGKNV